MITSDFLNTNKAITEVTTHKPTLLENAKVLQLIKVTLNDFCGSFYKNE